MKKILTVLLIFISVCSFAQRKVITDSLVVRGGGTFENTVTLDTNQVKQVDTATDDYDAVPFFQIMDSITGATGSNYWTRS